MQKDTFSFCRKLQLNIFISYSLPLNTKDTPYLTREGQLCRAFCECKIRSASCSCHYYILCTPYHKRSCFKELKLYISFLFFVLMHVCMWHISCKLLFCAIYVMPCIILCNIVNYFNETIYHFLYRCQIVVHCVQPGGILQPASKSKVTLQIVA